LEKEIAKGRLSSEDRYKVLERMSYSTKMEDLENTEFIVEAINESVELKEKVFRELDQIVPAESILASNTSSISITKIGGFT
jgi:3-hydroxybutyryl-CoA dehydrogenase